MLQSRTFGNAPPHFEGKYSKTMYIHTEGVKLAYIPKGSSRGADAHGGA